MDRYRRLGMEYRFHDDTAERPQMAGTPAQVECTPAGGDDGAASAAGENPPPEGSAEPR